MKAKDVIISTNPELEQEIALGIGALQVTLKVARGEDDALMIELRGKKGKERKPLYDLRKEIKKTQEQIATLKESMPPSFVDPVKGVVWAIGRVREMDPLPEIEAEFMKKATQWGPYRAFDYYGRQLLVAGGKSQAVNDLVRRLEKEELKTITAVWEIIQDWQIEESRRFMEYGEWDHNSTCPITNVIRSQKAVGKSKMLVAGGSPWAFNEIRHLSEKEAQTEEIRRGFYGN